MEHSARKITRIAREAERFVLLTMRGGGIGTAEIDCIHAVRHHPGITQTELAAALKTLLGVTAKVTLLEPNSIPRSEGKAVRVIDKRKLLD